MEERVIWLHRRDRENGFEGQELTGDRGMESIEEKRGMGFMG